jgi:hypothetical protein
MRSVLKGFLVVGALVVLAACVVRAMEVVSIEPPTGAPYQVHSPVKAHLLDGSTITFPGGATFDEGYARGNGSRWDLTLGFAGTVDRISIDSVAGFETYRTGVNAPATVLLSLTGAAAAALGMGVLAVAIFGSCPTFYDVSGEEPVLLAEGFSYSIAPLLESRDVDRLALRPGPDGMLRLEVRNEALETHYVNHLEILEVRHDSDEFALSDQEQQPIAVRGLRSAASAFDGAGRNVAALLADADGELFATAPELLAAVGPDRLHDHIDLAFPAPPGADSVALVLRLRNSLLTTILLYDVMLAGAGPSALDWLGSELERVGPALELAQWYTRQMGLHVQVMVDGEYRPVARLSETGPIAWKDVAMALPVEPGVDSVHIRLRFLADNWRIDRVALASEFRRPEVRVLPVATATLADGEPEPEALRALLEPDEEYLVTTPGQRYLIEFEPSGSVEGEATFLLASQGYYTEWMRPAWVRTSGETEPLAISDDLLLEALQRWITRRPSFEEEFYSSRIPVR